MDVFKSCHIRPFPGQGSICAITRRDWLRAFWMMKSEYQLSVSTAAYVWLQDMLDTFYECQKDIETDDFTHIYREFKLSIDLIQTSWDNLNKNQLNQMAIDITHRIAKFLMASSEQWSWYAYGIPLLRQRSNIEYEQITIVLSIVDLHGIVNDTLIPPVNITNIEFESLIEKFKNALKKGDLKIQNDNGTFYVSQISHCMDMKCHATTETIFAPSYSTTSSANHRCLSIFFLVFLTLTICIDRF
ncbi:hypothetical protein I4U23_004561 [Adineta vaga]|nr:hypothetical protein I4U23_004561 [Adineta vaga]